MYSDLKGWVDDGSILEVNIPTDADMEIFKRKARNDVWSVWIAEVEARGSPGQEVFDQWVELCAKYDELDPLTEQYQVGGPA